MRTVKKLSLLIVAMATAVLAMPVAADDSSSRFDGIFVFGNGHFDDFDHFDDGFFFFDDRRGRGRGFDDGFFFLGDNRGFFSTPFFFFGNDGFFHNDGLFVFGDRRGRGNNFFSFLFG